MVQQGLEEYQKINTDFPVSPHEVCSPRVRLTRRGPNRKRTLEDNEPRSSSQTVQWTP